MKIETDIQPRRDGTVSVVAPSGARIVFAADETGALVADVEDQGDLAFLLALADFAPADEADHVQAEAVLRSDLGVDDLDDDEGDENAAPVEVATPPKGTKHKPRK